MGRGLFNVESGSLSLCSSSECSSLATVRQRALKWSQGLSRDVEYLWHLGSVFACVCACVSLRLCVFPSALGGGFLFILICEIQYIALKTAPHKLTRMYISTDAACDNKRGVVFFVPLLQKKRQDMFVFFFLSRQEYWKPLPMLHWLWW